MLLLYAVLRIGYVDCISDNALRRIETYNCLLLTSNHALRQTSVSRKSADNDLQTKTASRIADGMDQNIGYLKIRLLLCENK